jgi:hypothetical protein
MMGRREGGQGQFFYSFNLDKVVRPGWSVVKHSLSMRAMRGEPFTIVVTL